MALIECVECGKSISDKAAQCVGCGNPIVLHEPVVESKEVPLDTIVAFEDMKRFKTNHILHLLLSIVTVSV